MCCRAFRWVLSHGGTLPLEDALEGPDLPGMFVTFHGNFMCLNFVYLICTILKFEKITCCNKFFGFAVEKMTALKKKTCRIDSF